MGRSSKNYPAGLEKICVQRGLQACPEDDQPMLSAGSQVPSPNRQSSRGRAARSCGRRVHPISTRRGKLVTGEKLDIKPHKFVKVIMEKDRANEPAHFKLLLSIQVSFPPQVYYKIFTYRPIVDICASSPKDYNQLQRMKYLTEERDPTLQTTDRTGWYQRVENNNWRLFSCKAITEDEPIDCFVTKKIDFHPSKLQRIQDVRKWKKRRKIEWLKRMYKEGREEEQALQETLEEQSDQSDLLTIERKTAKDVMLSIEDKGEDEILDWELDELLAWTSSLNFEEYMEEWKNQACSHTSEPNKDRPT
ncbi:uncharacterized protein C11orf65 homolog isoform X1 [Xiphophorus hellerii]|uniref:uncharacterized protein C11orf65 homolog isoform X1 n=1 Tax=Xiphophorus hellerii TaxID=8084 RepID=UPI0013B46332|nr:uncharacterized protein C11orf65 homolog isoform X1 [Xiphophorus hellerii]